MRDCLKCDPKSVVPELPLAAQKLTLGPLIALHIAHWFRKLTYRSEFQLSPALGGASCEKVFCEKKLGLSAKRRTRRTECIDFVREGDTLMVTRLDRLARSVGDLFQVIERLQEKSVAFRCLQQSGVDTDSSTGRLMLAILSAVAAFEADIRKERPWKGFAKAKAAGV
ncbi:MAG: recombinase family protein [Pontixanthobacter sp.]